MEPLTAQNTRVITRVKKERKKKEREKENKVERNNGRAKCFAHFLTRTRSSSISFPLDPPSIVLPNRVLIYGARKSVNVEAETLPALAVLKIVYRS